MESNLLRLETAVQPASGAHPEELAQHRGSEAVHVAVRPYFGEMISAGCRVMREWHATPEFRRVTRQHSTNRAGRARDRTAAPAHPAIPPPSPSSCECLGR